MSNSFYNHGSVPVYKSTGDSSLIRGEFDLITTGFNKLPTLGVGVANYLVSVDPSGTFITTIPNTYFLGTTNVLLSRASGIQALTGISIDGNSGTVTTNANLTGEATSVGNAVTLTNAAVIGKALTGYTSGAGVVAASDSILAAIQKLNGNIAAGAVNLTGPITSVGAVTSIASQTGTGTTFVTQTSPTLITPNIGVALGTSLGLGLTVARSPLHMAAATSAGASSYALIQATGNGGTAFTNTDTLPIVNTAGFAGYGGVAAITNRWGNTPTIDAHAVVYIGGGQRNVGAVSSSLVFANWGYFTSTGAAAGGLGNATDQADAVKFKFEHTDGGGAFAQTLQLITKSASLTQQVAMSVNNTGTVSLGGAVNAESLRVVPTASAVNFLQVAGAVTGGSIAMNVTGADANVNMVITPKGTGQVTISNGANTSSSTLSLTCSGASGVGLALIGNGATTPNKTLRVFNGNLEVINSAYSAVIMTVADSGQFSLGGGLGGESMRVLNVASAVNYLQVAGAVTGNGPIIQAAGTDANIALNHTSKGIGAQNFFAGTNPLLQLVPIASAVNSFQITNSATGAGLSMTATGTDVNVSMSLLPKGTGSVFIDGGANAGAAVLVVTNTGTTGSRIKIVGDGATTPSKTLRVQAGAFNIMSDAGASLLQLTDTGALSTIGVGGNITAGGTIKPATYLVSGLPAAPPNGTLAIVSDGTGVGYRAAATGGGTVTAVVMYASGSWTYS